VRQPRREILYEKRADDDDLIGKPLFFSLESVRHLQVG
jgi:hypothetical protein